MLALTLIVRQIARKWVGKVIAALAVRMVVVGLAELWTAGTLMMIAASSAVLSACTLAAFVMCDMLLRLFENRPSFAARLQR